MKLSFRLNEEELKSNPNATVAIVASCANKFDRPKVNVGSSAFNSNLANTLVLLDYYFMFTDANFHSSLFVGVRGGRMHSVV